MILRAQRLGMAWPTTPADEGAGRDNDEKEVQRRSYPRWIGQALKYSTVGISNTVLDAVLYLVLTHWLGLGGLKVLAKTISYGAGTLNSFHWNRSWTFKSRARAAATFIPFVLVSLAALGINAAAMYVSLDMFSQREFVAFALATGVTLLWNFGVTKFVVFRR